VIFGPLLHAQVLKYCYEFFNVVMFTIIKMEYHEVVNLSFLHLKNQILYNIEKFIFHN
jgi:hypothetical protein